MNCLGNWRVERYWLQSPPLPCYMTGVLEIFLQRPTVVLLLHRISHVAHCVYILTKALPLFTLLLKIAYVELKVGNGSMHLCHIYCKIKQRIYGDDKSNKLIKIVHIYGRWMMEWNTPFMNLSLLYLDNMRTWLYIYISFFLLFLFFMDIDVSIFFGSCFLGMPSFFLFFDSPCLIWKILEREIIRHGVLFYGWKEWHS